MGSLILDADVLPLDETGVPDFFWPVARTDVVAMRGAAHPALVAAVLRAEPADAQLLSIVSVHFLVEAITLFQARALCSRLDGLSVEWPSHYRLLPAVAAGSPPPAPLLVSGLRRGPARPRRIVDPFLRAQAYLRWNGLSASALLRGRAAGIVSCNTTELLTHHARAVADPVRYTPLADWFAENPEGGAGLGAKTTDAAIAAVAAGFAAGGERLPAFLAEHLAGWLRAMTTVVDGHMQRLRREARRLPRRLWTGTGGNLWARMLRHAVLEAGGSVSGHDHGNGAGHFEASSKPFVELESCDTFVTFNERQAAALRAMVNSALIPSSRAATIVGAPAIHGRRPAEATPRAAAAPLRRLLYPGNVLDGEGGRFSPLMPDVVSIDWQARLLGALVKWGYEVIYKPHPASVAVADRFARQFGVRVLHPPFERVLHEGDAFLFDYLQTTAFGVALATRKPMITIDFGLERIRPEAMTLLERRCRVVRGWFDKDHRAHVDWDALRAALEHPVRDIDMAFADHYLRYTEEGR